MAIHLFPRFHDLRGEAIPVAFEGSFVLRCAAWRARYDAIRPDVQDAHPSGGDAGVIVASHGNGEERILAEALVAGVPYVALVASVRRGEAAASQASRQQENLVGIRRAADSK